jgi:hypothetical protein
MFPFLSLQVWVPHESPPFRAFQRDEPARIFYEAPVPIMGAPPGSERPSQPVVGDAPCVVRGAIRTNMRLKPAVSLGVLDRNVAMDRPDVLGRTRDGYGFVCCLLTTRVAT